MNGSARYAGAVARLQNIARALEAAAAGASVQAANDRIRSMFEAVAASRLPKHELTGNALSVVKVFPDARGIALAQPAYLRYQRWWPSSRGVPPFLLTKALKYYREELQKLLAAA